MVIKMKVIKKHMYITNTVRENGSRQLDQRDVQI